MGEPASWPAPSFGDHERFRAAVQERPLDLVRAALLIAQPEYPGLEVERCLERIALLAAPLRDAVDAADGPVDAALLIARHLGQDLGFAGNTEDYSDPRNSFLNEVMERRTGIPITLSLIYLAVAGELGVPLCGVGFPGHFLVRLDGDPEQASLLVLDPFHRGAVLDRSALHRRLREVAGPSARLGTEHLEAATPVQILIRMLRNLKTIYLGSGDHLRALAATERILILAPDDLAELRDRGGLYERLGCVGPATQDLQRYLALSPAAGDRAEVSRRVGELQRRRSPLPS
jgi:regulator of sirC expression with transglutaminase-like and TPR domain